ncbi:Enoyl-CoA hydratase/carnithine racemase [Solimonas aquatica]|uniref:Enoyl-CoA hydratase/carnithine racemase n=1 Tax=Solimonas aquatica TaxID=489703 RepID=A0A1H9KYH0_9GAMM|nr:crotonase/enoyl-CoA hydratase family protein [Solimonas aquatica]SER03955.1 Enoyl-CoA hydratase/carnithine racemase [Solimonas aquatica]
MSASPFVRYEIQDRIVTLTLDRAESRNAIATQADCDDIVAALTRAQRAAQASCIVLTGAGSAFCAGGDLKAMRERSGIGRLDSPVATRGNYRMGVQAAIRALWDCELPMIAAVNGPAIGLGCDLACTCDLRIAGERARFASSFINVGLVPGDGGAWLLPRAVGLANAAELMLTGDTIDAEAARAMGLVSRVLPDAQLLDEAYRLAGRIVSRPAKTLRLTKRLLREGQQQRLSDILELSAAFQALAHETADHEEAVEAFVAKRPPQFRGH